MCQPSYIYYTSICAIIYKTPMATGNFYVIYHNTLKTCYLWIRECQPGSVMKCGRWMS